MKIDILAIGAHPDDVELGAGATIAKEIANGKSVGIIDLTRGELGTRGTAETRDAEADDAKNILGAKFRINMGRWKMCAIRRFSCSSEIDQYR